MALAPHRLQQSDNGGGAGCVCFCCYPNLEAVRILLYSSFIQFVCNHQILPWHVYSSLVFGPFTELSNHHHYLLPGHFLPSKKKSCIGHSPPTLPLALVITILLSVSVDLLIVNFSYKWIIRYVAFCEGLVSVTMFAQVTHVVWCQVVTPCIRNHILFIHSQLMDTLGWLPFGGYHA